MQALPVWRSVPLFISLLLPLGCFAQDQEPKCEGPLTEAKAIKLLEEGVTERRTIALLVACGMGFQVSQQGRARLKDRGFSDEAFKALEWLEKWESFGLTAGSSNPSAPKLNLAGAWTAIFSDSKFNGTLYLNCAQSEDGTIRGTYSSSLGGGGTILGSTLLSEAKLEVRQNIEGCPGVTKAILRKVGDSLGGEYVGFDCAGPHLNGKFTMTPGVSLPSQEAGKPLVVQGTVLELRLVRTVYVDAEPEHAFEKLQIESILRDKRVPLSDDPIKADAVLFYGQAQGNLGMAAMRFIYAHNTVRIVWGCAADPAKPETQPVVSYCAERFATAYAETHGN